jgi:hypothetical protein
MELYEAMQIVLELAAQNQLELADCDDAQMEEAAKYQEEALSVVTDYLEKLPTEMQAPGRKALITTVPPVQPTPQTQNGRTMVKHLAGLTVADLLAALADEDPHALIGAGHTSTTGWVEGFAAVQHSQTPDGQSVVVLDLEEGPLTPEELDIT